MYCRSGPILVFSLGLMQRCWDNVGFQFSSLYCDLVFFIFLVQLVRVIEEVLQFFVVDQGIAWSLQQSPVPWYVGV